MVLDTTLNLKGGSVADRDAVLLQALAAQAGGEALASARHRVRGGLPAVDERPHLVQTREVGDHARWDVDLRETRGVLRTGAADGAPGRAALAHGDNSIAAERIQVVFFDAGGVLLYPDWVRISAMMARHGISATSAQLAEAEYLAKRRMDDAGFRTTTGDVTEPDGYLGWVVKAADIGYDHEALHEAAREFHEEHLRANLWSVMPDEVLPVLGRLRSAGYRLGLISNTEDNLRPVLARTGLDTYFETLVISAEVGVEKPDPAIFREALSRMAVSPEHAMFVGDFYSIDVVGARAVGITPILLDARGLSADRQVTRVASVTELASALGA